MAWVDVRGADGRGVVGQPDAAALHLADGRRLPAADLARLWCRRLYGRDEGGLQNLGAGILALGSLAAGPGRSASGGPCRPSVPGICCTRNLPRGGRRPVRRATRDRAAHLTRRPRGHRLALGMAAPLGDGFTVGASLGLASVPDFSDEAGPARDR